MTTETSARRQLIGILVVLTTVWLLAAINPHDRRDWLLENLLVFVFFALLPLTARRYRFSLPSYWLFTAFMCLHLYGAHYTYSHTPLGFWLQEVFDLPRNHYDRVVHFSFGLLLTYPFLELLRDRARLSGVWLNLLTLATVVALSTGYELLEMLTALVVEPELGAAFLGTQGDEWDAQKDTGLALIGSIIALLLSSTIKRNQRSTQPLLQTD